MTRRRPHRKAKLFSHTQSNILHLTSSVLPCEQPRPSAYKARFHCWHKGMQSNICHAPSHTHIHTLTHNHALVLLLQHPAAQHRLLLAAAVTDALGSLAPLVGSSRPSSGGRVVGTNGLAI
eukprot:1153963-Pelagomonas_calceolata.AAC.2